MLYDYFLLTTLSTASIIALSFSPYLSINCDGVADSPKLSLTAINSCGTGLFKTKVLETLSPRPPKTLCSSAVTTHPVLETDFRIASSSNGLIV